MEKMLLHARAGLPNEACGLLAGAGEGGERRVEEVYCLTNIDASPEHFSMSSEEQFAAVADMRRRGLALLGNFHSHPATPARPSGEDIRLAFDPSLRYVIISLAQEEPVIKAFVINKAENSVIEDPIEQKISVDCAE
jgi:proteasome lid subunit RPN8/RPN11